MTTQLVRRSRCQRVEDPRLVTGGGRYLDDLGHDALGGGVRPQPARARPRSSTSTSTRALDVDGLVAIYTYEDLDRHGSAEPLPLLIPHPALHAPRTAVRAGQGRGQPRRRGRRHGRRERPLPRRGRRRPRSGSSYELLPAGRRASTAPGGPSAPVHDDVPGQRRGAHGAGGRRRRRRDGRGAAPARRSTSTIERSASMPLEGKGVLRPLGPRRPAPAGPLVDPDVDRRAGRDRRQARPAAGEGRGESRPTSAAASASRSCTRGRRRSWCRGRRRGSAAPVKWTEDRREHFISSAHERGQVHHVEVGFDDDGQAARRWTCTFWHDNGAYTPYGIIVPIITSTQLLGPVQARRLPGRVPLALHQHGDRHALPRRRPAAGRASRWSARWTRSPTTLGLDRAEVRPAQLHPARTSCRTTTADLPGRPAADLRLRRLPGVAGQAQGAGRLGRLRGVPRRGARAEGRRVGIGLGLLRRGHRRRARTRAGTSRSRPTARSRSRPG